MFGHVVAGITHGLGERVVQREVMPRRLVVASPQEVAHVSLVVLVQLQNVFRQELGVGEIVDMNKIIGRHKLFIILPSGPPDHWYGSRH